MMSTEILIENPLDFPLATDVCLLLMQNVLLLFNHSRIGYPRYAANADDTYRIYELRSRIASSGGQEIFL
jgi:hypothetical protein